jgi:hypothetical protein
MKKLKTFLLISQSFVGSKTDNLNKNLQIGIVDILFSSRKDMF